MAVLWCAGYVELRALEPFSWRDAPGFSILLQVHAISPAAPCFFKRAMWQCRAGHSLHHCEDDAAFVRSLAKAAKRKSKLGE
jgi:hypothetical protein